MNKLYLPLAIIGIAIVLIASGCGEADYPETPTPTPAPTAPSEPVDPCADVICGEGWECVEGACVEIAPEENITETTVTEPAIVLSQGWSDEYDLGEVISVALTDSKIEKLLDKKIRFNDIDYDISEKLILNGKVVTSVDKAKFDNDVYVSFDRYGIEYQYKFDDVIDTTEVTEDETLQIDFLGKRMDIKEVDEDCITYYKSSEYLMKVGESIGIEEKKVVLDNVGEKSVLVSVDGSGDIVNMDSTNEIDGVEITLIDIVYEDFKEGRVAKLRIGESVSDEICSGDGYDDEDSSEAMWAWDINVNSNGELESIGLKLNQNLNTIDTDFEALKVEDELEIGNYLSIVFDEISDEDYTKYDLTMSGGYAELVGSKAESFVCGSEEYRRIFMDETTFYDYNMNNLSCTSIELDESGITITPGTTLTLGLVEYTLDFTGNDLTAVTYDGNDISNMEETLRTYDDIIIRDVEDNFDDNRIVFEVPEEQAKITIVVKA